MENFFDVFQKKLRVAEAAEEREQVVQEIALFDSMRQLGIIKKEEPPYVLLDDE